MKRAYHDLMEQISVPSGLNDRVLQTVRQEAAGVGTRWKRTALRAAVCAACALALVLGTVRLAPRSAEEPGLPQLTYSFGLTAYAADIGETIVPNANGGLALRSGHRDLGPAAGVFYRLPVSGDRRKSSKGDFVCGPGRTVPQRDPKGFV